MLASRPRSKGKNRRTQPLLLRTAKWTYSTQGLPVKCHKEFRFLQKLLPSAAVFLWVYKSFKGQMVISNPNNPSRTFTCSLFFDQHVTLSTMTSWGRERGISRGMSRSLAVDQLTNQSFTAFSVSNPVLPLFSGSVPPWQDRKDSSCTL